MKRRILCFILTKTLLCGLLPAGTAAAASAGNQDAVMQLLGATGIMSGYADGSFGGYDSLTRGQFAKVLVAASQYKNTVPSAGSTSPFKDVPYTHWAAPYVQAAASNKLLYGYPDGTYHPDQRVTTEEAVTAVLRLLGYSDSDFGTSWPAGQMALAQSIGLLDNVTATTGRAMNRYNTMNLVYNMLNTRVKDQSKYYAESLGYTMTGNNIDISSAIDQNMSGPVTASGDWYTALGLTPSGMVVYRDGVRSTFSEITQYDCVYYARNSNTVWCYSDKVTGIYESASPGAANPSAIVVSGNTYALETATAYSKFSAGGDFKVGDTVTLILGKDGKCADAVTPSSTNSTSVYGYLMEAGTKTLSDGKTITRYAKVQVSNGAAMEYTTDNSYSSLAGAIVRVAQTDSGAKITKVSGGGSKYAGTFDSDAMTLGSYSLAGNIKIIDTAPYDTNRSGKYAQLYPQRLNGVRLTGEQISYCVLNEKMKFPVVLEQRHQRHVQLRRSAVELIERR